MLTYQLRGKLQQVVETSAADDPGVKVYLRKLREDLIETLQTVLRLEEESAVDESIELAPDDGAE